MLDLKFIRENTDLVRRALEERQEDSSIVDQIMLIIWSRQKLVRKLETVRHDRKISAKQKSDKEADRDYARFLRKATRELEEEARQLDKQLEELLMQVPNIPQPTVPSGTGEGDNVVVRSWGEPKGFDFEPKPHWKLGESLGIIDFERGVKLSGTRFYVLKGIGA